MHTQGCAPPQVKDNAEIMCSDAAPKGRLHTMRRWPFEPGQCILTPRENDDRGFGTLCGSPVPQLKKEEWTDGRAGRGPH